VVARPAPHALTQKKTSPAPPSVYRPRPAPRALQAKEVVGRAAVVAVKATPKTPAAPPVYRPQPAPRVLQPKAARPGAVRPSAPPAYRPQPAPKCLQPRAAVPTAPAPYRPGPPHAAPPPRQARPAQNVLQAKPAVAAPAASPARPSPVQAPAGLPPRAPAPSLTVLRGVIQRALDDLDPDPDPNSNPNPRQRKRHPKRKKESSDNEDDDGGGDGESVVPPKKKQNTRKQGFSKAFIHRETKSVTVPYNTTFEGHWKSDTEVSGTRDFSGERGRQILRHISSQLFHYTRENLKQNKEQEFQAMSVNGRILVAANEDGSISALVADLKQKAEEFAAKSVDVETPPLHPLIEILQTPYVNDQRTKTNSWKMRQVFTGGRSFPGFSAVETLLQIVRQTDFYEIISAANAGQCARAITGETSKEKIILVTGGKLHAEQKLLLALYRSGATDAAEIFGKKRPCTGCFLTLLFAWQKLHMPITFNTHPGGYWGTAREGLMQLFKAAKNKGETTPEDAVTWLREQLAALQTYQSPTLVEGTVRSNIRPRTLKIDEKVLNTETNKMVPKNPLDETGYDSPSETDIDDEL
ncbi:MAG TPA: hypothetical protein VG148_17485, partial [Pyrinomonadaceae bacterium]|nr:hypothetical protein [Pyrinomonadaceae bacterium]